MNGGNQGPDWEAEGLLDGLDSEGERAARRELVDRLHREGCGIEELRRAVAEDRLAVLPLEKLLLRDRRYTLAEAAELSGLPLEYLEADWRAVGMSSWGPDEPTTSENNIAALRAVRQMLDAGVSERQMLELTRMLGEASAKLADAVLSTFGSVLLKPGDTEHELSLRLVDIANALMPQIGDMLRGPMELHLAEIVKHEAIGRVERERGAIPGALQVAVAFADMVGFTQLSEELEMDELSEVTERFSLLAGETAQPPVRLVKTIGDEAMLASADAAALVETSMALIDAAERDDLLPSLRAGAAAGQALRRAGDWYGRPVNLAARITAAAPAGGLIANAGLRDAAGERFRWAEAGRRTFKGIEGEVELYRVTLEQ